MQKQSIHWYRFEKKGNSFGFPHIDVMEASFKSWIFRNIGLGENYFNLGRQFSENSITIKENISVIKSKKTNTLRVAVGQYREVQKS